MGLLVLFVPFSSSSAIADRNHVDWDWLDNLKTNFTCQRQGNLGGVTIQVLASIAHVYTDEIGPSNRYYLFLTLVLFLVDLVGFAIVFVLINSSIKTLKEAAETDGTAARDLGKMRLLRNFNGCVLVFWQLKWLAWIYVSVVPEDDCGLEWLIVTVEETVAIGFYVGMFYLFRPQEQNEYFIVQDEETALATIRREFESDSD
ncbi:hypothetical protein RHSIM_Rhsim05G0021500 [Rhododendron simsii]|uniref:GOST seven transmembrane domain-containing protein n=1 Tax=Rhododendron simsii TaxID=118357 RepID=A0A834H295_RHOSS|nr:hypothetical protein RHSIM_Rhsim05G0021500 [Rhododendron simsii]